VVAVWRAKEAESHRVKYWEIIANRLMKAGWSLGWISAVDSQGRTIWIADVRRSDGKRFILRADEKLTAFLELQAAGTTRPQLSDSPLFCNGSSRQTPSHPRHIAQQ
jgi:hypothetical protein